MLILSRRQNERINFPALGITIEVLRTGTRKIQLGIDAPADVRVVRDELSWREEEFGSTLNSTESNAVRTELRAVAMAIRLCQNQLRQGLNDHAESALDDAINSLHQLEERIIQENLFRPEVNGVVKEPSANYQTSGTTNLSAIVDDWLVNYFVA